MGKLRLLLQEIHLPLHLEMKFNLYLLKLSVELLKLMASAGCTQVCYGFESGDDTVLKKTGKGTTVEQGRQAAQWSKAAGIEVSGTFIVGLEGESLETIDRSIAFAKENDLDYVQVNVAVPMPTREPTTSSGGKSSRCKVEISSRSVR